MKIKQFGKNLKKLCMEEAVVMTIGFFGCDHRSRQDGNCATKFQHGRNHKTMSSANFSVVATLASLAAIVMFTLQCCRDHAMINAQELSILG